MIQNKKRIISLILMLTLLVSSLVVGAITASAEGEGSYVKVTEAPADWSGTYLIVYETGNVAFNGALTTLDAVSNTIPVSISNGEITANDATNAAAFTIDKNGAIKSASGYYIGQTSNANGLKSSTSTTYANTLSIDGNGNVNIVSGGAYLRYNATSGQYRFRYYKSSSYTAQKAICLYKLVESTSSNCNHNALKCEETCPECGTFVKEHKFTNNCVEKCENDCGKSNPNYAEHQYSNDYDASCNVCGVKREVSFPNADSKLSIEEANKIGLSFDHNTFTTDKYYVEGVVDRIVHDEYGNMYIVDEGDNSLYIYGVYSTDGKRYDAMTEKPEVGMTVTMYGIIGNYNGAAQMKDATVTEMTSNCTHEYEYDCSKNCKLCGLELRPDAECVSDAEYECLDGKCTYCEKDMKGLGHSFDDQWDPDCNYGCGETRDVEERPVLEEVTITFDADKTQRTEYTTATQVWKNGTLIVTNNKGASTSNVGDYSNPGRFYKSSDIIISFPGMTTLIIDAATVGGSKYSTPWADTLDAAGLTYTNNGEIYTITFAEPVDSITLTTTAQVRASSITAIASHKHSDSCGHAAEINGQFYGSIQEAINAAENGDTITLIKDVVLAESIKISSEVTIDLNGRNITTQYDDRVVEIFYVDKNGVLTIKGEGELYASMLENATDTEYVGCISAVDGGKVTIENGTFISDGCTAIYATRGGSVTINGGYYEAKELYDGMNFLIDINEAEVTKGVITISGGTFVDFNPANHNNDGKGYTNKVDEGYAVVQDGNEYTVEKLDDVIGAPVDGTITLDKDITISGDLAIVPGTTLDINGKTITATGGIVTFGTNQIIDSGETKGLIKVAKGKLVFTEGGESTLVPVWNEKDGYFLANITDQFKSDVVESENDDSFSVTFRPSLDSNSDLNLSVFGNGAVGNGIKFIIKITGTNAQGTKDLFVGSVSDSIIAQAYKNNGAIRITIKGADLNEYTEFNVQLIITNDTSLTHTTTICSYTKDGNGDVCVQ